MYRGRFSPSYATELFRKEEVKALIEKLRPQYEKELIRQMVKERLLKLEFLDSYLMHIIANGETHRTRGDADRVKAIQSYRSYSARTNRREAGCGCKYSEAKHNV